MSVSATFSTDGFCFCLCGKRLVIVAVVLAVGVGLAVVLLLIVFAVGIGVAVVLLLVVFAVGILVVGIGVAVVLLLILAHKRRLLFQVDVVRRPMASTFVVCPCKKNLKRDFRERLFFFGKNPPVRFYNNNRKRKKINISKNMCNPFSSAAGKNKTKRTSLL